MIYLKVNKILDHVLIPEETVIHLWERIKITINEM